MNKADQTLNLVMNSKIRKMVDGTNAYHELRKAIVELKISALDVFELLYPTASISVNYMAVFQFCKESEVNERANAILPFMQSAVEDLLDNSRVIMAANEGTQE